MVAIVVVAIGFILKNPGMPPNNVDRLLALVEKPTLTPQECTMIAKAYFDEPRVRNRIGTKKGGVRDKCGSIGVFIPL
jgi:hypothetical protein